MSQTPVPITPGSGGASVAAELVSGFSYQEVEIYGPGGSSVLAINPDGSLKASIIGNVNAVIAGGSIATVASGNQSISGTIGASIIGLPTFQTGNSSVITVVQGSVAVSVSPVANQSVSGTIGASIIGYPNVNVGGSVVAFQGGTQSTSLVSTVPSSVIVGSSIFGQLPGGTAVLGSVAALQGTNPWQITGSVQAAVSGSVVATVPNTVTVVSSIPGGIFPISGSVAATVINFPTTQNVSGSVAAFVVGNASVIAITQGSIGAVIIGGSIASAGVANQSVSGTVLANLQSTNASVIGVIQGSVATVIIGGSIAASFTPPANQSVSGTVQAQLQSSNASVISTIQGSVAVAIISGSVAVATGNSSVFLLNSPNTIGSVIAYQGVAPWAIAGSVAAFQAGTNMTSIVSTVPSSVLVGASIFGQVPTNLVGNTLSAQASILVGVTANTTGSVFTVSGYPTTLLQVTSGPGASITGQVNFEGTLDGTQFVPINGYNLSTNAIASATGIESDWAFNTTGLQGIRTRVSNWTVGSITARVVASPADARPFGVVQNAGTQVLGSVAALQGTNPWNIAGSVAAFQAGTWNTSVTAVISSIATVGAVMGSVATLQGTNPWVVNFQNSSILAVPVGSVQNVWLSPSIVGSYAEDAAHTSGDKGLLSLSVRNDTLSSVTSTDGDYGAIALGPVGEVVTANSPITKWVNGNTSIMYGPSIVVIAAGGTSIFNYVTGVQVKNPGATSTFGTLSDGAGAGSVRAYFIAPAGGGDNMVFPNPIQFRTNQPVLVSIAGNASVFINVQGFISKT